MVINLRVKTLDSQDHEFSVEDDVRIRFFLLDKFDSSTYNKIELFLIDHRLRFDNSKSASMEKQISPLNNKDLYTVDVL